MTPRRLRAERHAHADLRAPATDAVRGDAVQADAREQQRQAAEEPRQDRHQLLLDDRAAHAIGQRPHRDRDAAVHAGERLRSAGAARRPTRAASTSTVSDHRRVHGFQLGEREVHDRR